MVPSRDIPAGRSPQGWRRAPAILSAAAGWPGAGGSQGISREQSGCWQPAPRGGRVPRAAPAGVGENAQKAPGVCVLSPWQPRLHHRGGPAKTSCCGRRRDGGRRSSIPYTWGDIWGVSQWCDRGARIWGRAGHSSPPGSTECMALLSPHGSIIPPWGQSPNPMCTACAWAWCSHQHPAGRSGGAWAAVTPLPNVIH